MESVISLAPNRESVLIAQKFIEEHLDKLSVSTEVRGDINISFDEIYSNIVNYSTATKASISWESDDDSITITFTDNGNAFNPLDKIDPDVTLDIEHRQIGGLGIYFVKNMMEEVSYIRENELNILTIKKSL